MPPAPPELAAAEAAALIATGGVVAYPTEGVWGLGCDPFDAAAVGRLLAIKRRDVAKGLILAAATVAQLDGWIDWQALPAEARAAVRASWPGPNTWIVPAAPRSPRWITGEHAGVAVRVSAHPVVVALCTAFGGAIVSTSANLATAPAPRARAELSTEIVGAVDAIVAGETSGLSQPTTIRDARDGRRLR